MLAGELLDSKGDVCMHAGRMEANISIKVMSFNIAHGLGMDGIVDLEKTASVIEDSCAHVIGLQEVDRFFSDRSSFMDQVDWLSERLGMHAAFGANLDVEPALEDQPRRQYGNAILSKYPIKYSENHSLTPVNSDFGTNEPRGILEAVVEVKGKHIHVFNTHLALKEEELQVNIGELLDISGKRSKLPRLVLGDFNAPPQHPHIQKLNGHYSDAFLKMKRGDAYTYPAPYKNEETGEIFNPATRIDYIFSCSQLEVIQSAIMHTDVSDHLPIMADFLLVPAKVGTKQPAKLAPQKVW